MHGDRIDITRDFNKQERRLKRKEKIDKIVNWCMENAGIALTGFCAGLGLLSTGIKVGGRMYKAHVESRNKDYRVYDPTIGHYYELCRKLKNKDWLEIDRRRCTGERLGDILDSLHALK